MKYLRLFIGIVAGLSILVKVNTNENSSMKIDVESIINCIVEHKILNETSMIQTITKGYE